MATRRDIRTAAERPSFAGHVPSRTVAAPVEPKALLTINTLEQTLAQVTSRYGRTTETQGDGWIAV